MTDLQPVLAEIARNLAAGPEGVRLFHGRGGCFAGFEDLAVDAYGSVAVIGAYREGYATDALAEALPAVFAAAARPLTCILVQRRYDRAAMWSRVYGSLPDEVEVVEDGLHYGLTLMQQQNVGFFPDMRLGRRLVRRLAPGARVLNLFAYTCAFSVTALDAGAQSCVNFDLSRAALAMGRDNHRRNHQACDHVKFLALDILKSFGRINKLGPYDLVIIDPPSRQSGFDASRDYARIVRRLPECLAPDGLVMACLNAPHLPPAFLDELFAGWNVVARVGRPPEYVEMYPERALKIHLYRRAAG